MVTDSVRDLSFFFVLRAVTSARKRGILYRVNTARNGTREAPKTFEICVSVVLHDCVGPVGYLGD